MARSSDSTLYTKYARSVMRYLENQRHRTTIQQMDEYKQVLSQIPQDQDGNLVHIDPQKFYDAFGHFIHPFTNEDVPRLTSYQLLFWNAVLRFNNVITTKTNKAGMSSLVGVILTQNMMMKRYAGREKLIIAQKENIARDHLYNLQKDLLNSPTFSDIVIMKPDKHLLSTDVSKQSELFIRNPYNPWRPTRVKAIGATSAGVVSWRNVDFVWISDLAAAEKNYDNVLAGAFTRLALTRGKMVMETIPGRGIRGRLYEIWKEAQQGNNNFCWMKIPCYAAVDEGVMSQEWVDDQKKNLGSDFPIFYEAEWLTSGGNLLSKETIDTAVYNAEYIKRNMTKFNHLQPAMQRGLNKSLGVDIGVGSSASSWVICVDRGNFIEVVHSEEEMTHDTKKIVEKTQYFMSKYRITKVYVDAQYTNIVYDLKKDIPERMNVEHESYKRSLELRDLGFKSPFKINPIAGKKYSMPMIHHMQRLFSENLIAIDENDHPELLKQLKGATIINENYYPRLDKKTNGNMDTFDGFRFSLINFGYY